MGERINISAPLRELLRTVGIDDYNAVRSVDFTCYPDCLDVTVYERNADGKFFLDRTRAGLFPRTSTLRFKVQT